jgi:hypothetical protein
MSAYVFDIRLDPARNVVYMAQEGHADRDDMLRMRQAYLQTLARVRPGWVLVNDQRKVESFTDEALEVGKELVAITSEHGAAKVIRIAAEQLAPRTRTTRVLVSARPRYENVRVESPAEAEQALAAHFAAVGG